MIQLVETVLLGSQQAISGVNGVLTNLEVREYLNSCLASLNLVIMIMISRQIWTAIRTMGWSWREYPGAIFVVCLWWIFLSDFIRACLAWYLLHQQNNGRALTFLTPTVTTLYIVAGALAVIATLRLVYAVSPKEWGHKGWLAALMTTVLVVIAAVILD